MTAPIIEKRLNPATDRDQRVSVITAKGMGQPWQGRSRGRARGNDYDTSAAAAALVNEAHCAKILDIFRAFPGGLANWEVAALAGLPEYSCVWRRVTDLRQEGYVEWKAI